MEEQFLELKERLIESIFRVKHLNSVLFHHGIDTQMTKHGISTAELTLMKTIKNNIADSDKNTGVSDIQKHLYITKAAVSKMLGVLEKKGYINREVNKHNRRTLIITLTPEGRDVLKSLDNDINDTLIKIIRRLGKTDIERLIKSINRLADAASSLIE